MLENTSSQWYVYTDIHIIKHTYIRVVDFYAHTTYFSLVLSQKLPFSLDYAIF